MRLESGPWRAELLPEHGAAFATLEHAGRPILAPLEGRDPNATLAGAFWMLPWANRLDGGRFPWGGTTHAFPLTHPQEGNALHGLSRLAPWRVEERGAASAVLTQSLARGPFDYVARLGVTLGAEGLRLAMTVRHAGPAPCPLGFGWHPWFARPAGCAVRFAARAALLVDARKLPVAAQDSPGLDGGEREWLGMDTHFTGWDGLATLRRPDLALTLRAGGDWSRNLQFYAPADHPVLCLEPVSHVPDAINRPGLAPHGAMRVLAPGEALEGVISLSVAAPG
ncbi:aldose epimerase [Pseudoroseomonas rhizosphaerae]|uniref:Aldose epimerase n=1 Tax=Teichococcus rhizosphaerae TaxID=1335062 RepID=A0A2C7A500_9PROT|nr:aldose epimerase [Pseudoroseomonas rhizosphaerae]PHK93049.1 aldose epimerase [Pseudoroseomonas rhizosphaerae]